MQQGAANAEAARVAGRMNNPNISGPYGSQTVTWGAPGMPGIPGTPGTPGSPDMFTGSTAPSIIVGQPGEGGQTFNGQYWTDPNLDAALQGGGKIRLPGSQDWLTPEQQNGGWTVGGHGLEHLGQTFIPGSPEIPGTPGTPGSPGAGGGDQPTITQRLTPNAEAALQQQQEAELNLSRIAKWMTSPEAAQHPGTLAQTLYTPFSFGGSPQQSLAPGADLVAGGINMETPDSRWFQQMFGADYGQVQGAPNLGAYGRAMGIAPGTGGPVNQTPLHAGGAVGGGLPIDLQTSLQLSGMSGIKAGPSPGDYGLAGGAGTAPTLRTAYDTSGLPPIAGGPTGAQFGAAGTGGPLTPLRQSFDESQVARAPINAGTTAQEAIMARLRPDIAQRRMTVETQLINQGLRPGDEAYDNAIRLLGQQENDQLSQATLHGLNLDLAANAQGFGQAASRGGFANQAALQEFGAGMERTGMGNQAIAQNFRQAMDSAAAGNAAQQQEFIQRVQAGEFGNAAQVQQFMTKLAGQQTGNAAIQQNFQQALAAAASGNAAQQQQFTQRVQAGEFGNAAQMAAFGAGLSNQREYNAANAQNFIQNLQAQQAQNAAQGQAFEQGADITGSQNAAIGQNQQAALQEQAAANAAQAQGFGNAQTRQQTQNQATQQNFMNRMAQQQAWNQAEQQRYVQILQSAQFGNAAQQQALAQLLQQRQVPINEVMALLSGSQVQNPQFQAYQGQAVAPAPVFQGGQAQAGWDQNIYNQQVAQANALRQGLFSLAGAGMSAFSPFSFGGKRRRAPTSVTD